MKRSLELDLRQERLAAGGELGRHGRAAQKMMAVFRMELTVLGVEAPLAGFGSGARLVEVQGRTLEAQADQGERAAILQVRGGWRGRGRRAAGKQSFTGRVELEVVDDTLLELSPDRLVDPFMPFRFRQGRAHSPKSKLRVARARVTAVGG